MRVCPPRGGRKHSERDRPPACVRACAVACVRRGGGAGARRMGWRSACTTLTGWRSSRCSRCRPSRGTASWSEQTPCCTREKSWAVCPTLLLLLSLDMRALFFTRPLFFTRRRRWMPASRRVAAAGWCGFRYARLLKHDLGAATGEPDTQTDVPAVHESCAAGPRSAVRAGCVWRAGGDGAMGGVGAQRCRCRTRRCC
jgi:hypothetical protein